MSKVKISACQFKMMPETTPESFFAQIDDLLGQVPHNTDYVLFPELFTLALLYSFEDFKESDNPHPERLGLFTDQFCSYFREKSIKNGYVIIAGSHITNTNGILENTCFIFSPDGQEFKHVKTHGTPLEKRWNISEGNSFHAYTLGPAKFAVMTCYEAEFPEVARVYAELGAQIIFVPTWTTSEYGFWRIRHSSQARCIENQLFVIQCCLVGEPHYSIKGGYGRSAIITPCDTPWSVDGIECEARTNENMVISSVVDLDELEKNRTLGYVPIYSDYKRRMYLPAEYKPYSQKPYGSKRDDIIKS